MMSRAYAPFVLVICFVVLAGCSEARMQLSPELSNSAREYAVLGREGFTFHNRFSFGPYQIVRARRGWTERLAIGWGGVESSKTSDSFEFEMASPDGLWVGRCLGDLAKDRIEFERALGGTFAWELGADTRLMCRFFGPSGAGEWQLVMRQGTADNTLSGMIKHKSDVLEIRGVSSLKGTSFELASAAGYEFHYHGRVVGAVETLNAGRVWIRPSSCCPRESMLAALSAALLLYRDRRIE